MKTINVSNTQFCLTLNREDKSTVNLVASYFPNPRNTKSVQSQFDYYAVVTNEHGLGRTVYTANDNRAKGLDGLSVDEYVQRGRVGLMSVVRPHEIFKVANELMKKLKVSH